METEQTYLELREVVGPPDTWHNKEVTIGGYTGVIGRHLHRAPHYPDNQEGLKKIKKRIANTTPVPDGGFKLFKVCYKKQESNTDYQKHEAVFMVEIYLNYPNYNLDYFMKVDEFFTTIETRDEAIENAHKLIAKITKKNDFGYNGKVRHRIVFRATNTHYEEIATVDSAVEIEDVSHRL